ncbi:DUF2282 domain-containing protein [Psychromonas sp. MME2]|uniref:BufA1 family periplasmic bufferin-type metallophore n=1 Tax=unclassified Psychromonas TaxID=2614957 RepID=UPI00339CA8C0
MKKSNMALAATVSTLIAVGSSMISAPAMAAGKEKCYGVAAAGQNDCATKTSSCAGTAKMDRQGDAFIAVPKGLCEKLAGGSLTPKM